MGEVMFRNEMFDQWVNQKSLEILNTVEKEKLSTRELLILSLNGQVKHINSIKLSSYELKESKLQVDRMQKSFNKLDEQFDWIDERFDRLTTIIMWQIGIMITLFSGVYLKLYS